MTKLGERLVEVNPAEAQRWWEKAAQGGNGRAMRDLAEFLMDIDPQAGFDWLIRTQAWVTIQDWPPGDSRRVAFHVSLDYLALPVAERIGGRRDRPVMPARPARVAHSAIGKARATGPNHRFQALLS
ncbi:MAG: hypothetical protein ABI775_06895 [Pseudonocardiales bacterium]